MQLGFVSAILPDLTLEEVVSFARASDYECVELMCWPAGKAERRYAGVTHVDVTSLNKRGVEAVLEQSPTTAGVAHQRPRLLSKLPDAGQRAKREPRSSTSRK